MVCEIIKNEKIIENDIRMTERLFQNCTNDGKVSKNV